MLVEVFCVDWYPRKALVDPETTAAAPAVLAAWARYAARITGLDDSGGTRRWPPSPPSPRPWRPASPPDGIGGDDLDGLDPEMREAFLAGVAADGLTMADLERAVADGLARRTPRRSRRPRSRAWTPLAPGPAEPRRLHWGADAHRRRARGGHQGEGDLPREQRLAPSLLGEAFVQPAVDLAVRIGEVEPSPLPHTQDRAWASAIVWLLAEDSGAFVPRTPGRTRDDLAADLPLGRAATTKRVGQIRDLLGLAEGDLAVDW